VGKYRLQDPKQDGKTYLKRMCICLEEERIGKKEQWIEKNEGMKEWM